jgi:hypothetical protein
MDISKNRFRISSQHETIIYLFLASGLVVQWYLIFDQHTLYAASLLFIPLLALWFTRRFFHLMPWSMGLTAICIGGVGMALSHTSFSFFTGDLLTHHGTRPSSLLLTLFQHGFLMVICCVSACVLVCQSHLVKCINTRLSWYSHLCAIPLMCLGMLGFASAANILFDKDLITYFFSLLGMGVGNYFAYNLLKSARWTHR